MRIWGRPDKQLRKHVQARVPYSAWERVVRDAEWRKFADARNQRPDVDPVGQCYVFNLGGNKFRLIANIVFATDEEEGVVLIQELLTHAEYNKSAWKEDC